MGSTKARWRNGILTFYDGTSFETTRPIAPVYFYDDFNNTAIQTAAAGVVGWTAKHTGAANVPPAILANPGWSSHGDGSCRSWCGRRGQVTRRALLALMPAIGAAGCGYTLAGRGSFLPEYIRTIGIPAFGNTTPYATVEQIFTEKVRIEFQNRGQYIVIPTIDGADGVVRGTITGISAAPVGYTDVQLAHDTGSR